MLATMKATIRTSTLLYSFGLALLGVLKVAAAQDQAKHLVTLADLETLKSAESLQLSPAGDMLAYVVDEEIWIVATREGSTPQRVGTGAVPVWSPDGRRLAYYRSDAGKLQLWVREIVSERVEQLTHVEGGISPDPDTRLLGWTHDPLSYSWSPDASKLVFASRVTLPHGDYGHEQPSAGAAQQDTGATPLVLTSTTPPGWTLSGIFRSGGFGLPAFAGDKIDWATQATRSPTKVNELFVVDSRTKVIQQLTKDDAIYFNPVWSPDGKRIVCASSEGRSLIGDGTGTTNIYSIELATGKKTALTHGAGDKRMPSWSPDGKLLAFLGREHFGPQSVFILPSTGGEVRNVSGELKRAVTEFVWDGDSKSVLVSYQDGVSWPIARVNIETHHFENLAENGVGMRMHASVSRSGDLVWLESNGSVDGRIYILSVHSIIPTALVETNPQMREWELGEQEIVRWQNGRGEQLEGVLIKPVDYQEGRKYPVIVDVYPGQASGFKAYPMTGNQAWASRAYAVFWPNARAPHVWMNRFRSNEYDQAGKGPKGLDVMVDDIVSGVDELIRRGIIDPERMGLYGFSNGGGVVNQLVTKTSRFKCAVSVAGAASADWSRQFFLHTMDPSIPTIVGALPWQDPQAYIDLSAVYRLDRVTTPVLLADGDNDGDFLLNTIEMYNGLRYLERNVTFLRYPNQGHGFKGAALEDFWTRENAFFDKYLKPQQPPN
jgi:dipeptidyl aminopeptidase/acylaminoacyl peptidase